MEKSPVRRNLGGFATSSPRSLHMEAIIDADLDSYSSSFGGYASRKWPSSFLGRVCMPPLSQRNPEQADCYQRFKWWREASILRQAVPEFVNPHHDHPLFVNHWGSSSTPLAIPAALLLLIFNCIPHATIHRLLHVNHKAIEDMSKRLGQLRESWVVTTEKKIQLGTGEKWADAEADEVEADEATFDKTSVNGKLHWEQWCGILQRGRPHTLVLHRLKPLASKLRAPGPAVRKVEWKPLAAKWLQDRQVILHTDSAKRYASKVSSVLHDRIVHKKSGSRSTGSSSGWPDLCPDPDAQDPWHQADSESNRALKL